MRVCVCVCVLVCKWRERAVKCCIRTFCCCCCDNAAATLLLLLLYYLAASPLHAPSRALFSLSLSLSLKLLLLPLLHPRTVPLFSRFPYAIIARRSGLDNFCESPTVSKN